MSQRESNLLWMRDLLQHLTDCQERLEWAKGPDTVRVITETMLRDLERCRQLCQSMHNRCGPVRHAV